MLRVDYSSIGHVEELVEEHGPGVVVGLGYPPGASKPLSEAVPVNRVGGEDTVGSYFHVDF